MALTTGDFSSSGDESNTACSKTKQMNTTLKIAAALFLTASTVGCIFYSKHSVERGKSLDEQAVHRIVIGKTTRTDILNVFGPPHSIFQNQGELLTAERVGWYRYVETRMLGSIDEQHYAMLYRFGRSAARSIVILPVETSDATIKADELLIFLNKTSNIVSDVGYRNETGMR